MPSTAPQMPMGQAAKMPVSAADLASLSAAPMPASSAPAGASGLIAGPSGTPLGGGIPAPSAPVEPPYEVVLQADGSSVYQTKTTPPVVIGVNRPPKLPPSLSKVGANLGINV